MGAVPAGMRLSGVVGLAVLAGLSWAQTLDPDAEAQVIQALEGIPKGHIRLPSQKPTKRPTKHPTRKPTIPPTPTLPPTLHEPGSCRKLHADGGKVTQWEDESLAQCILDSEAERDKIWGAGDAWAVKPKVGFVSFATYLSIRKAYNGKFIAGPIGALARDRDRKDAEKEYRVEGKTKQLTTSVDGARASVNVKYSGAVTFCMQKPYVKFNVMNLGCRDYADKSEEQQKCAQAKGEQEFLAGCGCPTYVDIIWHAALQSVDVEFDADTPNHAKAGLNITAQRQAIRTYLKFEREEYNKVTARALDVNVDLASTCHVMKMTSGPDDREL